jgi:nitrate reductase gamma subunit
MFEALEEKKVGVQPIRFAYVCVVVIAAGSIVLNLRRYGWLPVLDIGTPAAILALALLWLNAAEAVFARRTGNKLFVLMCIALVARGIFFS